MKRIRFLPYLLTFAAFLLIAFCANTQDNSPPQAIDISKIKFSQAISDHVATFYFDKKTSLDEFYSSSLAFTPGLVHKKNIPNEYVTKNVALKFRLYNSADTAISIVFFPGLYYRFITMYAEQDNKLKKLPQLLPPVNDSIGYRIISLAAHDSQTVVASLGFIKTYINTTRPRLVSPEYLDSFITNFRSLQDENNLVTYLFCGLLLMMILFSLANFMLGGNQEFLYYSGYAFFLGTMLLTKAVFTGRSSQLSYFLESYLDFIMQGMGIIFYMIFMQKYLETRSRYPFLHKLYNAGIPMLVVSLAGYTFIHYLSDNFTIENTIENLTKLLLLVMTVVFLVYSVRRWNDKLLRYLFWGNLCLFVFSLFSQMIIMDRSIVKQLPVVLQSSLFYYEFGLFLELVFFLIALSYKNRTQLIAQARERERLKAENQMKEYEKELAVFKAQQQERERISADMHDELGSGMTAIRLMSEIARNKMKNEIPAEIEKISQSADEVLNKMNAIIWSMNSGNDTLDNLVSYIRSYALEYFENTPVQCTIDTPKKIEPMELSGDKRRNIFLCIKETLNNTLKHSKARAIKIDFSINSDLVIKINDNGIGIDLQNIRQFGNGLKNIARRMESIGGNYQIKNEQGTTTVLTLPL
jgi:signal transduction histidine kinase